MVEHVNKYQTSVPHGILKQVYAHLAMIIHILIMGTVGTLLIYVPHGKSVPASVRHAGMGPSCRTMGFVAGLMNEYGK